MSARDNEFGQPIGEPVPDWTPRAMPADVVLQGRFCRVETLDPERHAADLHDAYRQAPDDRDWTYMHTNAFPDAAAFRRYADRIAHHADPKHYVVVDNHLGKPVGDFALMRINPNHGVIEVGHVAFSPLLKRTPASTEAQFLLMQYVFDTLRYRRYEWKCDSLNAASRQTAARLGFRFEGIFRQAIVYKDRSRDTAWFSIIDQEWPAVKAAFLAWLSDDNFDDQGRQLRKLTELRINKPQAALPL